MNYLMQLSGNNLDNVARDVQKISEEMSETELYAIIGNALHDLGYTVAHSNDFEIITPKAYDEKSELISLYKSVSYVANTKALEKDEALKEGKSFWSRFGEKLRSTICSDPKIKSLITGQGTLKDYLTIGIPMVLAALGVGAINPVLLAIIAASFALIVKVGFKAYCELD